MSSLGDGATEEPQAGSSNPDAGLVEYTKDGNVSKMRSHKGNAPTLPQTKLCPLCPAKFTRTTHLNRHLRTHSNERLHECDRCHSQFTRSDLLSRHKRSCGDSSNTHRSRRKSCQACAESKVKCNQQHPCSKCQVRGRECIYKASTSVRRTSRRKSEGSSMELKGEDTPSPQIRASVSSPSSSAKRQGSGSPQEVPSSTGSSPAEKTQLGQFMPILPERTSIQLNADSDSLSDVTSSYSSSTAFTASTAHSTQVDPHTSFAHDALEVQNQLNALFSNEMFDKFFSSSVPEDPSIAGVEEIMHIPATATSSAHPGFTRTDLHFPFPTSLAEAQPFMASIDPYDFDTYNALYSGSDGTANTGPMYAVPNVSSPPPPLPSDLQYYFDLFFTRFLEQMPIVHVPTFSVEHKPPILISAMQACGALYVKTPTAVEFMNSTLASSRDAVVAAFAKKRNRPEDHVNLVLSVCLLQTMGLFHERPDQRAQSNLYHAMLVMMIRQSGLLLTNVGWQPPVLDQYTDYDAVWRDWVSHETAKRALSLTFLHDCCHCIFFNLRPTFLKDEFNLHLPCEDALWKATTSQEWRLALMQQSPYGSALDRIRGGNLRVQCSLLRLASSQLMPALILNPFSQFILIHAILRRLFEDCLDKALSGRSKTQTDEYTVVNPTIQYMLHNWLQSWFQSPETPRPSKDYNPVFFHDALPFYWIGQVSLLAYQEGLPPFASDNPAFNSSGEAKFGLMKEWFRHIRGFLRNGEQGPTLFWDELMKIRMRSWEVEGAGGTVEDPEGLLGFFLTQ